MLFIIKFGFINSSHNQYNFDNVSAFSGPGYVPMTHTGTQKTPVCDYWHLRCSLPIHMHIHTCHVSSELHEVGVEGSFDFMHVHSHMHTHIHIHTHTHSNHIPYMCAYAPTYTLPRTAW